MQHWQDQGRGLSLESFEDYVLDKHTSEGRGKSSLVFAQEGALIPDEDKRFLVEQHRQIYVDFKKLQEGMTL